MGLFDLIGEVVSAPLRIAGTAAKATVRTAGAVVTLDERELKRAVQDALDETEQVADDIADSAD